MGISYILDIVIGLFFIYLIASLLASEIQELIATIMQWRAIHIKQSIDGLLSGNDSTEFESAQKLADKIYENPLIKDLNHEAKGWLGWLGSTIAKLFGLFGVFGILRDNQGSGPSHISNQVFATSFLETLQIPILTKLLTRLRLEEFIKDNYKGDQTDFNTGKKQILLDYEDGKRSFSNVLDAIAEAANNINTDEAADNKKTLFNDIFGKSEVFNTNNLGLSTQRREFLLKELTPSLLEIIRLVLLYRNPEIKKIIKNSENKSTQNEPAQEEPAQEKTSTEDSTLNELIKNDPYFKDFINEFLRLEQQFDDDEEIKKIQNKVDELIKESSFSIPKRLQYSLYDLARRSQLKVDQVEKQLQHFQTEIEDWFNQSMDRASGVYKRNAKLVAVLIGFIIALACNIDSFHVVNRISQDQALRDSLSLSANTIVANGKSLDDKTIQQLKSASEKISLPIGWENKEGNDFFDKFKKQVSSTPLTLLGWVISAIAISMGSSFWFDLLGKFINVKNVGKIPNPNSSSSSSSSNSSSGSSSSSSSNSSS
jgi:hypothetical protein